MSEHLREHAGSFGGFLATAALDLNHAPRLLTILAGVATLVHAVLKIVKISLEIRNRRKKYKHNER